MLSQKLLSLSIPDPLNPNGASVPINVPVPGIKTGTPGDVNNILSWALGLLITGAVLLALGYIVYGGIMWITSQGDKQKVESARKSLTYAVGGLILAFLAFFVIKMIGSSFGFDLLNLSF